jgi:chaperone required for assembly of F1-ATPase
MKRFWKEVAVVPADGGWGIELDGRPVRTPARAALVAPTEALANAIGEEWRSVGEEIDLRAMPLTGLANAAIDRVAPERQAFAGGLARYAEADLACYRSDWPPELVERQAGGWDKLLSWARRRYDVDFSTTSGLLHVPQPTATVERLSHAVAALDAFRLAGLSPLVTIGGSLIAALAVLEKAMTVEEAWEAVSIDERWQLEQWGADSDAETALENKRRDFFAAARFLELVDSTQPSRQGGGAK